MRSSHCVRVRHQASTSGGRGSQDHGYIPVHHTGVSSRVERVIPREVRRDWVDLKPEPSPCIGTQSDCPRHQEALRRHFSAEDKIRIVFLVTRRREYRANLPPGVFIPESVLPMEQGLSGGGKEAPGWRHRPGSSKSTATPTAHRYRKRYQFGSTVHPHRL
jgi:hypothetical protein